MKADLRPGGARRCVQLVALLALLALAWPTASSAHSDHDHDHDAPHLDPDPDHAIGTTELGLRDRRLTPRATELASARPGSSAQHRYSLANGCFALRPVGADGFIVRDGEGYSATASSPAGAEKFRLQATRLGSYLLLGAQGQLLSVGSPGPLGHTDEDQVRPAGRASAWAEWIVRGPSGPRFEMVSNRAGRALGSGPGGALRLVERGETGSDARVAFVAVGECPTYPEVGVNAMGSPRTASPAYGETRGLIDLHAHIMAFEAFGGNLHCGRPWHPWGVEFALVDCPDHAPMGLGALVENIAAHANPLHTHHPDGWPTFQGWPTHDSFTHEQTYYRWLERTWRAGLRIKVMLAVDNSALCLVNPHKTHSCNEMQAVRRQLGHVYALEDYVDAQSGGPGRGWFRVVKNPFQARKVINQGKLAVVPGIEVSEPLDCGLRNEVPQCDRAQIERELDRVYDAGVRQMELVNKFDNALAGVAMDGGLNGPIVNTGNRVATGKFWEVETCTGEESDNTQDTSFPATGPTDDLIAGGLLALLPPGQLPVYPPPPHCNVRGLTDLGEHAILEMMKRGMIFDPDHMSVKARDQALDVVEREGYGGIVSSHSWAGRSTYQRIFALGGVITPMARSPQGFVDQWEDRREDFAESGAARRYDFATGFGDDMNGFASQGAPTAGTDAEISYPFRSIDGAVRVNRQQSGTRTFDMNEDGIAHFGLFADWAEGVRLAGGEQVVEDLERGTEAYLRMWERAVGIRGPGCLAARERIGRNGLGPVRLGVGPRGLLRRAGQPEERGRAWHWCVRGARGADVTAVLGRGHRVSLVSSSARRHSAAGVRPGTRVERLRGEARSLGNGAWVGRSGRDGVRVVFSVRRGRVQSVGIAARAALGSERRLARHLRVAGAL